MKEQIISPGVFARENDISFLAQGVGSIGAAIIGPFKKGPAFLPTVINTQSEFEDIFGTPDGTYYTGYTVQNYLREASSVTVVRVGHMGGYSHVSPVGIAITGSNGTKLIASLQSTSTANEAAGFSGSTIDSQPSASAFSVTVLGASAISSSILPSSNSDISDVFGEAANGSKSTYTYKYFESAALTDTDITNGGSVKVMDLGTQDFTNDIKVASTPWIKSQLISGERSDLFRFHTLGFGNTYNKEYKISIFNVKPGVNTNYPTFSIILRGFSDTDQSKTVLATYSNLNLNPTSPNYIAKVIGNKNTTIDSTGKITEVGDYDNKSKYIRVEVSEDGTFPQTAGPFGHGAYTNPIYVGSDETIVPAVTYSTGSNGNTASSKRTYSGIDLETTNVKIDNNNYLSPIPVGATTGSNVNFALDSQLSLELTGSVSADVAKRQFTIAFQNGFDGISPVITNNLGTSIVATNSQGFDLSSSTASGSVAYLKAINSVSNPDEFDINLLSAPGVVRRLHSYVFDKIVDMVEAREDVFFIGDVTTINDSITLALDQGEAVDSNYVATYYPWVKTIDRNTNRLTAVPPSVLMPAIYASNDNIAAEWWAPAGLNRGGIVGAVSVVNRLKHAERDELYEGKINPIASFPGEGIVAFGQKTLQEKASALDRINVRRLLIKVKKYIASTSRYLIFEQNTARTRNKFINTVTPYLEGIQQRQGIYSFKVVMDETNNTPDVIDRNIMAGQLFLQPTKTAEFIILDFNIMPSGASFSN